jgi:hypothetical protein
MWMSYVPVCISAMIAIISIEIMKHVRVCTIAIMIITMSALSASSPSPLSSSSSVIRC